MDKKTACQILGIGPDADLDQAKTAYRARAKEWHPDRFAKDTEGLSGAEEKMKLINAAFRFLAPVLKSSSPKNGETKSPEKEAVPPNPAGLFSSVCRWFENRSSDSKQRYRERSRKGARQGAKKPVRQPGRSPGRRPGQRPDFASVLNAVAPGSQPESCLGGRWGRQPLDPYKNYRKHMAVKKRLKAARHRSEQLGSGRVEKVTPVRRVQGTGE